MISLADEQPIVNICLSVFPLKIKTFPGNLSMTDQGWFRSVEMRDCAMKFAEPSFLKQELHCSTENIGIRLFKSWTRNQIQYKE